MFAEQREVAVGEVLHDGPDLTVGELACLPRSREDRQARQAGGPGAEAVGVGGGEAFVAQPRFHGGGAGVLPGEGIVELGDGGGDLGVQPIG